MKKLLVMPARKTNEHKGLVCLLRQAGRNFQAGKPIDIAMLRRSIEAWRKQRPAVCATLTDLIQEGEEVTTRGDRLSALNHFRAAIEFVSDSDRPVPLGPKNSTRSSRRHFRD